MMLIIPSISNPRNIIVIAMAASSRLKIWDIALKPPPPSTLISLLPKSKIPQVISRFRAKDISTMYRGNSFCNNSKVVIVAGPAVSGVPIGTTPTIAFSLDSTILPLVM